MKFTKILTKIILEDSRFKILYDKYVKPSKDSKSGEGKPKKGVMDFETLKTIILGDPTTRNPQNLDIDEITEKNFDTIHVGQYSQWLLKNYNKPELSEELKTLDPQSLEYKKAIKNARDLFLEDLYKVTDDLRKFEKAKRHLPENQRDINQYTISSLFDLLKDFKIPEKNKSELEKKEAKKSRAGFQHKGGDIIYQGPNWTLVRISDKGEVGKDAACYYGGFHEYDLDESRWCTSSPGLNYFNTYIKDGPLYVIFPNDDKGEVGKKTGLPKERYQFHFPSNQFMDRQDRQINLIEFLNGRGKELKEIFKPEFAKGLIKSQGKKLEISYPNDSSGKFVALYGFDELFESLPKDLEVILIDNKSNEKIALNVPESLGNFSELTTLSLKNIVKSIPESIGKLENLLFLSLPNNPDLKKLPESIANLEQLNFINLNGSNPQIPNKLSEKLTIGGEGFYYVTN